MTTSTTPRPWRAQGGTVYDADGVFVLDCWWEDAARIAEAVNAQARVAALEAALRTIEGYASDGEEDCGNCARICDVARALLEASDVK